MEDKELFILRALGLEETFEIKRVKLYRLARYTPYYIWMASLRRTSITVGASKLIYWRVND